MTYSLPDRSSVVDNPLDCLKTLPLVWDVEGFKDVREGSVIATNPADGSFQVKEALLLQRQSYTSRRILRAGLLHVCYCKSVD